MTKKGHDAKPTISDLDTQLKALDTKIQIAAEKPFDPKEHKDKTRSKIAFAFTIGYFILLGVSLVGVPIYNLVVFAYQGSSDMTIQLRDVLLAVSGISSGPIGFVVGYYFKGSEENGG